jgi:CheY-like chemotaxis protein
VSEASRCPTGLRILVVDDGGFASLHLAVLLRGEGHHVRWVRGRPDEVEDELHREPDVVVLDFSVPDADRWDVTDLLRDSPADGKRPLLIALRGYGAEEAGRRPVNYEIDLVLPSSAGPEPILRLVRRFRSIVWDDGCAWPLGNRQIEQA